MRKAFAAALGVAGLMIAGSAVAAPVPAAPGGLASELIQKTAEGCGRGFFRNARGRCRPMRGFRRPAYRGRRCVVRRTPYGVRRVCRW